MCQNQEEVYSLTYTHTHTAVCALLPSVTFERSHTETEVSRLVKPLLSFFRVYLLVHVGIKGIILRIGGTQQGKIWIFCFTYCCSSSSWDAGWVRPLNQHCWRDSSEAEQTGNIFAWTASNPTRQTWGSAAVSCVWQDSHPDPAALCLFPTRVYPDVLQGDTEVNLH